MTLTPKTSNLCNESFTIKEVCDLEFYTMKSSEPTAEVK